MLNTSVLRPQRGPGRLANRAAAKLRRCCQDASTSGALAGGH